MDPMHYGNYPGTTGFRLGILKTIPHTTLKTSNARRLIMHNAACKFVLSRGGSVAQCGRSLRRFHGQREVSEMSVARLKKPGTQTHE